MDLRRVIIDTEQVIQAVRSRPIIWNSTTPGYVFKADRSQAWADLCKELVPEYEQMTQHQQLCITQKVQQRWRSARDCYVKRRSSQLMGRPEKTYGFGEQLTFLEPTLRMNRKHTSEHSDEETPIKTLRKRRNVKLKPVKRKCTDQDDAPPKPPTPIAKEEEIKTMTTFERRLLEILRDRDRDSPLDEDDNNFFKSLAPILAEFTTAQKLMFRQKVLAIAMTIQQEHAVYLEGSSTHDNIEYSLTEEPNEDPIEEKYDPSQDSDSM